MNKVLKNLHDKTLIALVARLLNRNMSKIKTPLSKEEIDSLRKSIGA